MPVPVMPMMMTVMMAIARRGIDSKAHGRRRIVVGVGIVRLRAIGRGTAMQPAKASAAVAAMMRALMGNLLAVVDSLPL